MRRIVASTFVTLDGVMEAPESWSFDFQGEDTMHAALDLLLASEALLLGRVTYQGFAAAWPSRRDPLGFADTINRMPKYVVSQTVSDPTWDPTTVIRDDVPAAIRELKSRPGGDILMYGSATLMRSLAEHDLVDEYNLLLSPVVVGAGKRLFPEGIARHKLRLVDVSPFRGGIVALRYQPTCDRAALPVPA